VLQGPFSPGYLFGYSKLTLNMEIPQKITGKCVYDKLK
jgi:hypothetical protein